MVQAKRSRAFAASAGNSTARLRQPSEVRIRQIAEAALKIIAARGLREFTAKAIGRELGVTDAAVFRHLPTKKAIVQAAIGRVEELLFEGFPPAAEDPLMRLGLFFRHRARTVAGHAGVARLIFSEDLAHAGGPEENARILAFKQRSAAFVKGCLEEARRRGMLVPGVHVREGTLIVMGALMAFVFSGHGNGFEPGIARDSEALWNALEGFLRKKT
jgi:AcrR family transcriptional regulator